MKVAFGSDERTPLTDAVRADLESRGHDVVAVGPVADDDTAEHDKQWAEVGHDVGELVVSGAAGTGVLFCWTGTGASIAANKVRGVRAALCTDAATAAGARAWNDANVLVMGLRLTSPEVAARCSTRGSASRRPTPARPPTSRSSTPELVSVSGGAALREADEVAARVVQERHPLLLARRAERAVVVAVDQCRLVSELDTRDLQPRACRVEVVDGVVEHRFAGAGLEHESGVAEVEEREPGRVEAGDERQADHVAVEGDRRVEVGGAQRHLVQPRPHAHRRSSSCLPSPRARHLGLVGSPR